MRRKIELLLLALCCSLSIAACAQQDDRESARKVINRVVPTYPDLARAINLKGTVRVEALVGPDGKVKSLEVKGGSPVLVQAAQNAIQKWRWERASHDTREPIEVQFNPK